VVSNIIGESAMLRTIFFFVSDDLREPVMRDLRLSSSSDKV
jgi:hypothetical protein